MNPFKVIAIVGTILASQIAHAGVPLGVSVSLPLLEGGLLTIGAAALVVGVRIIRAKSRR